MLLDVVRRQAAVARHRSTLFAPHLDEYLDELQRLGNGQVSLRLHLSLVTRLGEYLAARGVRDLSGMRQEHVADFLRRERHRRERTSQARRKVSAPTRLFTGFLHYLEERGKWWREAVPPSPILDCFLPFPRG